MLSTKPERALRRAVEQLSHCNMDDIEWIWSTLDAEQRQRLRPLLAEARPDWHTEPPAHGNIPTVSMAPDSLATTVRQLAEIIRRLPTDLAGSVLACLDDNQRKMVAEKLPSNVINTRHAERPMTKRAQHALRNAALASANHMAEPPASKQPAWRCLFQRKVRE